MGENLDIITLNDFFTRNVIGLVLLALLGSVLGYIVIIIGKKLLSFLIENIAYLKKIINKKFGAIYFDEGYQLGVAISSSYL